MVSAVALALASPAGAATLSIAPDKLVYGVGETVTLTVIGDDEDALAYTLYGRLLYDASLADPGASTQNLVGPGWVQSPALIQTDGTAEAFYQHSLAAPAPNLPGTLSTVTLIAQAVGVVNVDWDTAFGAFELYFYGVFDVPGTSFTIVPEPGTGALLGLGLLSLAARHRPRRE